MFIYGPAVASDLADFERVNSVIDTLTNVGTDITRYNLNDNKEEFAASMVVERLLAEKGAGVLPIVIVDKKLIISRSIILLSLSFMRCFSLILIYMIWMILLMMVVASVALAAVNISFKPAMIEIHSWLFCP